jgi:hypothetical protein
MYINQPVVVLSDFRISKGSLYVRGSSSKRHSSGATLRPVIQIKTFFNMCTYRHMYEYKGSLNVRGSSNRRHSSGATLRPKHQRVRCRGLGY